MYRRFVALDTDQQQADVDQRQEVYSSVREGERNRLSAVMGMYFAEEVTAVQYLTNSTRGGRDLRKRRLASTKLPLANTCANTSNCSWIFIATNWLQINVLQIHGHQGLLLLLLMYGLLNTVIEMQLRCGWCMRDCSHWTTVHAAVTLHTLSMIIERTMKEIFFRN